MGEAAAGRGLLRQIGAVSAITGASQIAFLAANLLLGRHLAPAEFGRLDLANKIINLTAFLSLFGLNSALVRSVPLADLARYDWKAGLFRLAGPAAAMTLAVTALAAALYHFTPLEAAAIALASWFFALTLAGGAVLAIQRRFALSQLLPYLWRWIVLAAAGGLLLAGRLNAPAILVAYAAAGLVQAAGVAAALRQSPSGREPLPTAQLLSAGLLFFGLFMTSTLMLRLDAFLLAGLVDTAALGRYAAAGNIALTGYGVLSLGVSQVLSPRVASHERLSLGRLLGVLIAVGGSAGVLATIWGTPLIHALYGHRYPGSFSLLLGLFCAAGLVQVAYVIPSALLGVRAPLATLRLFLLVNVVSVAINVGLNVWLIPRQGLEGAALATLLSWVWRLAWAAELARRLPPRAAASPEAARGEVSASA